MTGGKLLLNIDAGEHDDEPEELYALADVVNIACGGHAGDARSMERVLRACKAHGTRAGAHPSFEDRQGFGRRELAIAPAEIGRGVARQCRALAEVARAVGVEILYVKAHGALYHLASRDTQVGIAVRDGVTQGLARPLAEVTLIGPPSGELRRLTPLLFGRYAREGFADRAMRADGSLVPRGEPGAIITDAGAARAQVRALLASDQYDTVCVHGDTPDALEIARAVRQELDR